MKKEYDVYLVEKYAPLYKMRHAPMTQTCMCWGFEVGDGWFNLIDALSYYLCSPWLRAKEKYENVKDRLGRLKYEAGKESDFNPIITQDLIDAAYNDMIEKESKVPVAVQVKEKFGTLRFYADSTSEEDDIIIRYTEFLSGRTCEVCGAPGTLNDHGWIRCRCEEHKEKD